MNRKERRAARRTGLSPGNGPGPDSSPAPLDPRANLLSAALRHHQAGRLAEAEKIYRDLLALDPNHADSLHLLGLIAHQRGQNALAVETIGKAIALNERASTFHNNIAEAYRVLGRLDAATEHLRRAIALEPNFAEAHMNLGNVLKQQHAWQDAEAAYRQALAIKPDYPDAHLNFGVALMDQGKLEEAATRFERALVQKPDNAAAHMNLGIVLQKSGRPNDAIAKYRKALALDPQYVLAHINLGDGLFDQGKVEEAVRCYETALRISTGGTGPDSRQVGAAESIFAASFGNRRLLQIEDKALMDLVRAQCWQNPVAQWARICDAALKPQGLWPPSQYELLVRKGISQWLALDIQGLDATLRRTPGIDDQIKIFDTNVKNSRAYGRYLHNLLAYAGADAFARLNTRQLPRLPIIGDSHGLAYDGMTITLGGVSYYAKARLVMGCKAFHLGDEQPNRYKWRFEKILADLADNSAAIISLGEIDCRLDEGILPHYRKVGGSLEQLIEHQVVRFVDYVVRTAAVRGLRLIFLGVPAPHFDAFSVQHPQLSAEDRGLLVDIIEKFNRVLERTATGAGHRFVDLSKVTASSEGQPSGAYHLDDYHLKPDALRLALADFGQEDRRTSD